jgi:hypothetical protein
MRFARLLPTWRQGFLTLAAFVVVSAAVWSIMLDARGKAQGALVPSWFELWERCRVAIEDRQPLNTFGLVPSVAEKDPTDTERPDRTMEWRAMNGGRFVIRESEMDTGNGTLRSCNIAPLDWRTPLTREEAARLTYAFLEQRSALLTKGTHEAREPAALFGVTSSGFGPLKRNAVGCLVVSVIFSAPEDAWFKAVTAEQESNCDGGPPLLPEDPASSGAQSPTASSR